MSRRSLLTSAGLIVLGGALFGALPAYADMPTIDITVDGAIQAMSSAMTNAISSMEKSLTNAMTDLSNPASLSSLLTNGFSQNANYAKAQVGAQQQIADANNEVMSEQMLGFRDAQMRDEQTPSPQQCVALDSGQTAEAASLQGWRAMTSIEQITDARGEAGPGTPAWYGAGQASAATSQLHMKRYCSQDEASAGLCSQSQRPNADQRASSLFGADNLGDVNGVNAANDFGTTLIQPIPPAALRGDQLTSINGQDAAVRRRAYNARMSLARSIVSYAIGQQTPGIVLTQAQQQEMQNEGIPVPASGSWMQVISLEVNRRLASTAWQAGLQNMPPASVAREIATELALSNYIQFQNYKMALMQASLSATQIAQTEEHDFPTATQMPSPSMATN